MTLFIILSAEIVILTVAIILYVFEKSNISKKDRKWLTALLIFFALAGVSSMGIVLFCF